MLSVSAMLCLYLPEKSYSLMCSLCLRRSQWILSHKASSCFFSPPFLSHFQDQRKKKHITDLCNCSFLFPTLSKLSLKIMILKQRWGWHFPFKRDLAIRSECSHPFFKTLVRSYHSSAYINPMAFCKTQVEIQLLVECMHL